MTTSSVSLGLSSTESVFHVVLSKLGDSHSARVTLSRRESAQPIREDIDDHLGTGEVIEFDCAGADATQSFMDELVGILVLERGPTVLSKMRFRGCSKDMKAIINFVVSDRAAQFMKNPRINRPIGPIPGHNS